MSDMPRQASRPQAPVTLLSVLTILSILSIVAGVVAALMVLGSEEKANRLTFGGFVVAMGCLLAGLAVGCLLWAITHMVRRQSREALLRASAQRTREQHEAQEDPWPPAPALTILPEADSGAPPAEEPPVATTLVEAGGLLNPQVLQEILAQLKDLNENLLLTHEQREAKRALRQEKISRRYSQEAERAIEQGNFLRAEKRLEEFADRVPRDPDCVRLRARLAEARAATKAKDIETYTRQVYDLMAISSFERAEETARELRDRYPNEPDLTELIRRVQREGKMFHGERRERMYREIARHAESRQWRAALEAARNFIQAFPKCVDADAIRAMVPTIEDNARIEEVREIRDQIRDLIQRRRYAEAVTCAEDIVRRFPDTQAARELGRQLNRLRELARTPAGNRPPS
jgi:outer membrane protein assembly factor BamD (BamD/ComL family)